MSKIHAAPRWQFSLKSLLVAVVAAGMYLSLMAAGSFFEFPVAAIYGIAAIGLYLKQRTRVVAILALLAGAGSAIVIRLTCYPINEFSAITCMSTTIVSVAFGLPSLVVLATYRLRKDREKIF